MPVYLGCQNVEEPETRVNFTICYMANVNLEPMLLSPLQSTSASRMRYPSSGPGLKTRRLAVRDAASTAVRSAASATSR